MKQKKFKRLSKFFAYFILFLLALMLVIAIVPLVYWLVFDRTWNLGGQFYYIYFLKTQTQIFWVLSEILAAIVIVIALSIFAWFWKRSSKNKNKEFEKNVEEDGGAAFAYDEVKETGNRKAFLKEFKVNYDENADAGFVINFNSKSIVGKKGLVKKINASNNDANAVEYFVLKKDIHAKVLGGTGSGKSQRFILPTAKYNINLPNSNKKPNLIFSDPKGEILEALRNDLEKNNYMTIVFDLENPLSSIGFNFLTEVWDKYHSQEGNPLVNENEANQLLDQVIHGIFDWPKGDGETWSEGGRNILKAIAKFLLLFSKLNPNNNFTKKHFNLATFNRFLTTKQLKPGGEMFETIRELVTIPKEKFLEASNVKLNELNGLKNDPNWNEKTYNDLHTFYDSQFMPISNVTDTTLSGQLSSANKALSIFVNDIGIKSWSSRHELNLSSYLIAANNPDAQPVAIFIKFPDSNPARHRLVSTLVDQVYSKLIEIANKSPKQKYFRKNLFLLDEFGNLPKIVNFDNKVTIARSRNIFFAIVLQDYNQLGKYDEGSNKSSLTIKNNMGLTIFLNSEDDDTLKAMETSLGETKIRKKSFSFSSSDNAKGFKSVNESESLGSEKLVTIDELKTIPKDIHIVQISGQRPLRLKSTFAYEVWNLPKDSIAIEDTKPFTEASYSYDFNNEFLNKKIIEPAIEKFVDEDYQQQEADTDVYKLKEELAKLTPGTRNWQLLKYEIEKLEKENAKK
ncbi:type IV secretory system conjugative DNA transfer family protein [Candidatus Mycoplasma pogonae]